MAPVARQSSSLAVVAGHPQSLTPVAGQSTLSLAAEARHSPLASPKKSSSPSMSLAAQGLSRGSAGGGTSISILNNDSDKCHFSNSSNILAILIVPTSRDSTEPEASENTVSLEKTAVDTISVSSPACLTTTGKTSGITHNEMITPVLPLWQSKNIDFKSPPDCWWSV